MQRSGGFLARYSLILGILLMFLFTWPIDLANAGLMPFQVPFALYLFLGWGFGLAVALMTWATLGWPAVVQLYKRYLIARVGWKWYAALLIIPLIMVISVYLNAVLTGAAPDFSRVNADNMRPEGFSRLAFVIPFLLVELIANGEEIGWRGYVLPRLQAKYSALTAAVVTGVVWGLWHIPKFLTHWDWSHFGLFMVDHAAKAILLAWIYNGTRGSLLLVVLAHGFYNTMGIFLPSASTLSSEGLGAYAVEVVIEIIVAAVVVARTGAANLSRTETRQMQD